MVWDVRDFGAAGDGEANDTAAIQKAIDACSAAGGGRVVVPSGMHRTGTLYLKSHVELHLSTGAVLLGSASRSDYNPDDVFPENQAFSSEHVTAAHLIIAYRVENVAITGHGIIDGNSSAFFGPLPVGRTASYRYKNGNLTIPDWRPGQMLFFCRCRNVQVSDVSLINAPYWTLFLLGCEDVHVRGLTITNPPGTANGDGIDIDCSRNVTVSDCTIFSGDDCITLRGNSRPLGEDLPCENVTVTNCILATPCNAIRIGVGDGTVRHCRLSNLLMPETRTGINIVCRYSDVVPRGTQIQDVHISDVSMNAIMPMQCIVGHGAVPPAGIDNMSFSRFQVTAEAGFYVGGNPDLPVRHLQFCDWDVTWTGGADNAEFADEIPYPYRVHGFHGRDGQPALPAGMVAMYAEDLLLHNLRFRWRAPLGKAWRDAIRLEHTVDATIRNARLGPPRPGPSGAAVRCTDCADVRLEACRADAGTDTFLALSQSRDGASVTVVGCDLRQARVPFETDTQIAEQGNLT